MSGRPLLAMLHGPNLDLLGQRPAEHYGTMTLPQLEASVSDLASQLGWECVCHQTNYEGQFIEWLHDYRRAGAVILNPGAWTHYSYAIRDAVELLMAPVAEVHLSDVSSRESWRSHSVISDIVTFTVSGKGPEGYLEAVRRLVETVAGGDG